MMKFISIVFCASLAMAADKGPPISQASNDKLAITATAYIGKDAVKEQVGSDLGGYFLVIKVDLAPKGEKPLVVNRDDFLLRSYKDGQKCQPFAPSQIAGRGALVVGSSGEGGGMAADQGGPVWGPGPGIGGRPSRMPGSQGSFGSPTSGEGDAQARITTGGPQKDDPVLATLKQKLLPDKEISGPLSGFLYFSLEGKHKSKDLVLQYSGPAGKLNLSFK